MPGQLLTVQDLDDLYGADEPDPPFSAILATAEVRNDAELAELIEADGRTRIRRNRPVDLGRYIDAIPDLASRADALDAAIDMALRWMARTGRPDQSAIDDVVRRYPELEHSIREAGALSHAIWSTNRLRTSVAAEPVIPDLPHEFGPEMPDGKLRYELMELLGDGAFGEVYLAVDRQLSDADRPALVAIKALATGDLDPWERQRNSEEATKARRIEHPNVVRVIDRGSTGDRIDYIVYEYVDGGDLARWVRRRSNQISTRDAAELVAKIARGVHAAHMAGLIHCDLKPHNVMMTNGGTPKVADFGIAVRLNEEIDPTRYYDNSPDRPGEGNLAFISPEQYRREPAALTVPSDVYALGGILYWLLTSRLPNGDTPQDVKLTHSAPNGRQSPPSPAAIRRGIDRDLDSICRRAMATRPGDRHNSAAELANDLESWLRHESIKWTNPSYFRRLQLWGIRRPGLAGSMVALTAVVAIAAGIAHHLSTEAAVAKIRFELQNEARLSSVSMMRAILELEQVTADVVTELLPFLWVVESLSGPGLLDDPSHAADVWKKRITIARREIDRVSADGGEDSLEVLLWETVLVHWLVTSGDFAESRSILDTLEWKCRARLNATDPWFKTLRVLRLSADANQVIHSIRNADGGKSAGERAELVTTCRALDDELPEIRRTLPGSPQHRLILIKLIEMYDSDLLDRPERRASLETELQAL